MTFSALATGTAAAHGKYSSRQGVHIQYLIVHHWAGTSGGDARLVNPNESVSASYILYGTGALIGQVPEEYRPWTSGSWDADAPAITVETQNSANGGDWPVSDAAVEMLAQLAADLCTRYGWGSLDRSRVRGHREFAATACPGPYLWARLDAIVARGNQIISGGGAPAPEPTIEEEDDMNTYFEATSNSSPLKEGDGASSRIWAGERKLGGVMFSSVWERSADGKTRRLFLAEWEGIKAAYAAAGRKVPLAKVTGNAVEQLMFGKRL